MVDEELKMVDEELKMVDEELKRIESEIEKLKLKKENLLKKQSVDKVYDRVHKMPLLFDSNKMDIQIRIGVQSEVSCYEHFRIALNKKTRRLFINFIEDFFELSEIEEFLEINNSRWRDDIVKKFCSDFADEEVIHVEKELDLPKKKKLVKTTAVNL